MFTTKNTALLAPYGSAQFMPLATKVGDGKNPQFITQSSNGEGKGLNISTAADTGKIPSARD